ncbi:MAG: GNAT family N-acetyltransferase [Candidatus Nitrosotenuis sp.]
MILKKYKIFENTVILRYPKPSDAQDLMNLINSLVKERVDIAKTTPVTIKQEKLWLKNMLESIRQKEKIMIIAELDGICVGSCEITKDAFDVSRHVGTLGIGLIKQARGIGIGSSLIKMCMAEAKKKLKLKLVKLYVFDTNNIGKSLYEEIGFKEIGRIPKGVLHNKKYKDDIIMAKKL